VEPAIKWSGSKRSQSKEILKHFPKEIDTYYEPFCGGCSVLMALIESDIKVKEYYCSDLNKDLIGAWEAIKSRPLEVAEWYETLWNELNKDSDLGRKKKYFGEIRERLNKEHNPLDFIFIMRTTTNGMPRYNKNGEFNNSFHITRNGIQPSTFKEILSAWSEKLKEKDIQFKACSYEEIQPSEHDFMYMDPPYANTKGMYFGDFDVEKFFKWLETKGCGYTLSFDGIADKDHTYDVPVSLYSEHIYINSGNSSFRRVIGKNKHCEVLESLYVNEGGKG